MTEEIVKFGELELRAEIYAQLDEILTAEQGLERGYARFGVLIVRFKKAEAWRGLGYRSFDAFMEELKERYHCGRTQLYNYVGVAEKLLALISEETLDEIGISKAIELKRAVAAGGLLTDEMIETARKPETTIKELRALLQGAYQLPENERLGAWFDFGGTYLTIEEKKAFAEACQVAMVMLQLSKAQPEWLQRKRIMLAFAQEFFSTYAREVYGTAAKGVSEMQQTETSKSI